MWTYVNLWRRSRRSKRVFTLRPSVFECVSKTTSLPGSEAACWYHNMDRCLPPKERFPLPTNEYLLRLSWMNRLSALSRCSFFFFPPEAKTNWSVYATRCLFFLAALHKLLREVCCAVRVKVCGNKIAQTLLKDLAAWPWAALVLKNWNF